MVLITQKRYVEFMLLDSSNNPISGVQLSDLQVFFTRNAESCNDTLTLIALSGGRYVLTYTPSTTGHDYVEVYYPSTNTRFINVEDIYDQESLFQQNTTIDLTQNYGGVGNLKPDVSNPTTYTLYIFNSSDWDAGKNTPVYALAATNLNAQGDWVISPITITRGTYNLVLFSVDNSTVMVAVNLQV